MASDGMPDGILTRFRTLSLERVGKVETTWNTLLAGAIEPSSVRDIARELHTLKGDARIVGFDEVATLAHKLEELFALANQLQYRLSEDLELVITMALQFIGLLLRKKQTSAMSGIDLVGFVRQVDEVLREARTMPIAKPRAAALSKQAARETALDRLSERTRHRLAIAATAAFLEYLSARSTTSRHRLRGVWTQLRDELAALAATPLVVLLERHVHAATRLATELGKRIVVDLDVGDIAVDARVAEALDLAMVHLIRNAIDHGIERPDDRVDAGKSQAGLLAIRARTQPGLVEISVEDDGAGVDLDAVRLRAIERGLVKPERAARASDREVLELVFHAGFSTRADISETSGRGIGLDAVKTAIVRAGGAVRVTSEPRQGTTVTLEAPAPIRQLRAYQFLAPGGQLSFAVSARWDPSVEPAAIADALDPMAVIQLPGTSRQTQADPRDVAQKLALRLRWGFLDVVLQAASQPQLVTVERICPTPDDYPIEIVMVDERETILLRPEHVAQKR